MPDRPRPATGDLVVAMVLSTTAVLLLAWDSLDLGSVLLGVAFAVLVSTTLSWWRNRD